MKILHRDGEIAKKAKEGWYPQNCVLIEDDDELEWSYEVTIAGRCGKTDEESFITVFYFPEKPNDGEVMYCLRKAEIEHRGKYYNFNASVDKIFRINDKF